MDIGILIIIQGIVIMTFYAQWKLLQKMQYLVKNKSFPKWPDKVFDRKTLFVSMQFLKIATVALGGLVMTAVIMWAFGWFKTYSQQLLDVLTSGVFIGLFIVTPLWFILGYKKQYEPNKSTYTHMLGIIMLITLFKLVLIALNVYAVHYVFA